MTRTLAAAPAKAGVDGPTGPRRTAGQALIGVRALIDRLDVGIETLRHCVSSRVGDDCRGYATIMTGSTARRLIRPLERLDASLGVIEDNSPFPPRMAVLGRDGGEQPHQQLGFVQAGMHVQTLEIASGVGLASHALYGRSALVKRSAFRQRAGFSFGFSHDLHSLQVLEVLRTAKCACPGLVMMEKTFSSVKCSEPTISA
jgi:hypothetical protein